MEFSQETDKARVGKNFLLNLSLSFAKSYIEGLDFYAHFQMASESDYNGGFHSDNDILHHLKLFIDSIKTGNNYAYQENNYSHYNSEVWLVQDAAAGELINFLSKIINTNPGDYFKDITYVSGLKKLIISGHGTSEYITLGKETTGEDINFNEESIEVFKQFLNDKGNFDIFIRACQTAALSPPGVEPFAKKLAEYCCRATK